jgi:D-beta-D-heptose 7-phosphate kinase / D-beta-D-heptose 1-phosphate adenosyltransferase
MNHDTLSNLLQSFHQARVLVLGDVMLDRFVYGTIERISPEAPIPVMKLDRTIDMPGGASNVARNITSLGAQAILIGVTGKDAAAQDLAAQLEKVPSIDPRLVADQSRPTTLKTRYVADRQQVLRADTESRAELSDITAQRVLAEFRNVLPAVDVVVLSDYAKGVLSQRVTREAIAAARDAGKPVLVDPKGASFAKYAGATLLTPNKHELQVVCGLECSSDEQVVTGASGLLAAGLCDHVVVTRGSDGMSVLESGGSVTHMRTVAREVFDVSGAGDTAVATISLGIAVGGNVVDASHLANLAAGIAVGKSGTAVVTTGELLATLNQFSGRGDAGKIFAVANVAERVRSWRDMGLRIAFTNGCFDLLHPGHISLLEQARRTADRLVVGVNSDLSVLRLKGPGRPVQSEVTRATVLASMKSVDAVVIFPDDTPLNLITELAPDVLVKGADYAVGNVVGADVVLQRGGKIVLADFVQGHSTTGTVSRVAAARGT